MRQIAATALIVTALSLTACAGGSDETPDEQAASSPTAPNAVTTPTPTPTDVQVFTAEFAAKTEDEQEEFCSSMYDRANGRIAVARELAEENGYEETELVQALAQLCPEPVPLTIMCEDSDAPARWKRTFVVDRRNPDYSQGWTAEFPKPARCLAPSDPDDVYLLKLAESARIVEPVNDAEAAILARYATEDIDGREIPFAYATCIRPEGNFPLDDVFIDDMQNALLLCPDHPDASRWEQLILDNAAAAKQAEERARAQEEARQEQQRLIDEGKAFDDGLYRVGEDIQPGTYVIDEGVSDCYWERQDAAGDIIDNYFGTALRVEVTIQDSDYGFLSEDCGLWRRR